MIPSGTVQEKQSGYKQTEHNPDPREWRTGWLNKLSSQMGNERIPEGKADKHKVTINKFPEKNPRATKFTPVNDFIKYITYLNGAA